MKKTGKTRAMIFSMLQFIPGTMRTRGESHRFRLGTAGLSPARALPVNGMERSQGTDPRGLTCLIKSLDFVH